MPTQTIVYWRDIPAQVIVKAGRRSAKRQLEERFEQAIDMAAMRSGQRDTDSYLEHWRRGEPVDVEGDDIEALAEAAAEALHRSYDGARVKALIENGGHEPG